jgi:hypothetical protein
MGALKIPDDLAAQASLIPGLSDRVARFIQLEIVQYEQRMKRFSPATIDLVNKAKTRAQSQRAAGCDVDEIKKNFERHLDELTEPESIC